MQYSSLPFRSYTPPPLPGQEPWDGALSLPPPVWNKPFEGPETQAYRAALASGVLPSQPDDTPLPSIPEEQHGTRLEAKCIDMVYDAVHQRFVPSERAPQDDRAHVDPHAEYAFTLYRTVSMNLPSKAYFEIRSKHLRSTCAEVIGKVVSISWTAKPLRIDHEIFLVFLTELRAHCNHLEAKRDRTEEESTAHTHLSFFLSFLRSEYASTLSELEALLAQKEITYDLLWAILKPRTIIYTTCLSTGEPRAARLVDSNKVDVGGVLSWQLNVEFVDYNTQYDKAKARPGTDAHLKVPKFGLVVEALSGMTIASFKGAVKIASLKAFPLEYNPLADKLTEMLIERGRKWAALQGGMHHIQYDPLLDSNTMPKDRIMIDRESYSTSGSAPTQVTLTLSHELLQDVTSWTSSPSDGHSSFDKSHAEEPSDSAAFELSDEDLLITSPCLYGFSFPRKKWITVGVSRVSPIEWNDEPFANLILSGNQKALVKALVETHYATDSTNTSGSRFDDFVQGKGQGLVINLFGNPGVGKTLTAEATSEYVRKPLRVIGAADLGTTATSVDSVLTSTFAFAARWGAIILIDEADVFLEQRSLHDLHRNAMVAVFLRQLEYFRGILFLTTNRVRTFDSAFQSRIHVSLRYHDLSFEAKRKIWIAFLAKAHVAIEDGAVKDSTTCVVPGVSEAELAQLADRKINGRQIKNAVRTASALATSSKEVLGYKHLDQVLEMMAEFESDLNAVRHDSA